MPNLYERARQLRRDSTDAERALWRLVRGRRFSDYKFRRQVPLGLYIVDFVCLEQKLVVEIDGGQHSEAVGYDSARTELLESQGFRVLRFWNNEALSNPDGMVEMILAELRRGGSPSPSPIIGRGDILHPHPSPLPLRERG